MTIGEATLIIARHAAARTIEWEVDNGCAWEDDYPNLGENDWHRMVAEAVRYAKDEIAPTPTEFAEAYALLGSLAGDDES